MSDPAMKINQTKEWYRESARLDDGAECGAGFAQANGSTMIGEFTDARGKVRQCISLGVLENGRCKGLLKIRYSRNGRAVVAYISPSEFRSDEFVLRREQERLRHMEEHSNDIYGVSSNNRTERRGTAALENQKPYETT